MSQRSFETHGQFFGQYLQRGVSVLDCACGPGTITLGIARRVEPAEVIGVDAADSQVGHANMRAREAGISNIRFQTASCYSLPFPDSTFDRVFSHALLEHLSQPESALAEFKRVLKPGGYVGVCSPDWGGFIVAPPSAVLTDAIAAYMDLQTRNGGDVFVGRKLGVYLSRAGFSEVVMSARYECYASTILIGNYLAQRLRQEGDDKSAGAVLEWTKIDGGLFAQSWISAVGRKVEVKIDDIAACELRNTGYRDHRRRPEGLHQALHLQNQPANCGRRIGTDRIHLP